MRIDIINGPNLNLLGAREPEIYGQSGFEPYFEKLQNDFPDITFSYFQSNIEGELIDRIHQCANSDGIILNAAAYTHTSVAIGDAVKAVQVPVIEVHISNVFSRETFRHTSFIAPSAIGCITGLGLDGYELAVRAFQNRQKSL